MDIISFEKSLLHPLIVLSLPKILAVMLHDHVGMDVSRIYEFLACRAKAKHVVGDDLMSETSPQKVVQSDKKY